MLNKFPYFEEASSRKGCKLEQVNYDAFGEGRVPFRGGIFTVEPSCTSRPDTHEVTEVWLIVAGEGLLNYDDSEYSVKPGDTFLFEPNKTHYVTNTGEETLRLVTSWWLEKAR